MKKRQEGDAGADAVGLCGSGKDWSLYRMKWETPEDSEPTYIYFGRYLGNRLKESQDKS